MVPHFILWWCVCVVSTKDAPKPNHTTTTTATTTTRFLLIYWANFNRCFYYCSRFVVVVVVKYFIFFCRRCRRHHKYQMGAIHAWCVKCFRCHFVALHIARSAYQLDYYLIRCVCLHTHTHICFNTFYIILFVR